MSNQYIGARYVPKQCGDWDNTKGTAYESLSVVQYGGASYTSKQAVPTGTDITNTTFWVKTADYNAQVALYHQDVLNYQSNTNTQVASLTTNFNTFKTDTNSAISTFETAINNTVSDFKNTTNTTLQTNQNVNLKLINDLSSDIGNSQVKKSLMAQAEKKLLSAVYELDTSSGLVVTNGIFTSTNDTTMGLGVKGLNTSGIQNITLHASLYWSTNVKTVAIGFSSNANGTAPKATETSIFGFDSTYGFVFKDTSLNNTTMLTPAQLTTGWYDISLTIINNGTVSKAIVSITTTDQVNPYVFTFDNLPYANNIVLTTNGTSDMIKNIKYCFLSNSMGNLLIPNYEMTKNFHYPIKLTYNSKQFYAYIPASYKSNLKQKCVIYMHDKDKDAQTMWGTNQKLVLKRLLDEGYLVLGSNNSSLADWGNPQSITDFTDLIDCFKDYLNFQTSYYVYAEGMGFLSALNLINHLPSLRIRAIVGLSPAADLENIYNKGTGVLASSVASAYNITSTSDYTLKVGDYNPMASDCTKFITIPMLLFASANDTIINKVNNADAFASKLSLINGDVSVITTNGDHLDLSNYNGDSVAHFFDQY